MLKGMRTGGIAVIRQAISCDICGSEKKQTNHWFVAFEHGGELRISGWTSRNRLRPGSRHLCGQTCLHKLVDEFMARALAVRVPQAAVDEAAAAEISVEELPLVEPALARPEVSTLRSAAPTDTSLTSSPAEIEFESSARLIPSPRELEFESSARLIPSPVTPVVRRPPLRAQPELVAMPARPRLEDSPVADEPPRLASRNWRAEAWDRERERELRTPNRGTSKGTSIRRRSGSLS
jgi:hypothetical protein